MYKRKTTKFLKIDELINAGFIILWVDKTCNIDWKLYLNNIEQLRIMSELIKYWVNTRIVMESWYNQEDVIKEVNEIINNLR